MAVILYEWMQFVSFLASNTLTKMFGFVCHSFMNKAQYDAGFAGTLKLKVEVVPTQKGHKSDPQLSSTVWSALNRPEFVSSDRPNQTLVWTKQINSGRPENKGLSSLSSEPCCGLLTVGNANGPSSEPKRQ